MPDTNKVEELEQVEVGLLQNFVGILPYAPGLCALIDPAFEVDRLARRLGERGLGVGAVLLTHGHPDHIDGVPEVLERYGPVPVYLGAGEEAPLRARCGDELWRRLRLVRLEGESALRLGDLEVQALATPGHTAAGVSYYVPARAAVFTGDTLFVGSCGAARFPGSDARALHRSLQRLLDLPEETRVYPGHDYGPTRTSSIGWELERNPALRCASEAEFLAYLKRRMG